MKLRCFARRTVAMTLMEVLMVIAVLLLLAALLLPVLANSRRKSSRIWCTNNLKQIALSFRVWAGDNNDLYPMNVSIANGGAMEPAALGDAATIFQVMSNELSTPKILVCANDRQHRFATNFVSLRGTNLSYFVGLDAGTNFSGSRVLAGDANLTLGGVPVRSGLLNFASGAPVKWDHGREGAHSDIGNLAFDDDHVEQLSNSGIINRFAATGLATNRLAIP